VSAIIGFDTATALTAVAAIAGDDLAWESAREPVADAHPAHVPALLADVEEAARALGGWEAVDRIAVGSGPGSFTGLRVGVATARALAQATGTELVGVSTLATLAAGMRACEDGDSRRRLAVLDARRGELFASLHDASGREEWPPFVASPAELGERLKTLSSGPMAAGDGSIRFRAILEAAGAEVPPDSDPVHRLSARWTCELASGMRTGKATVEPLYLRRPDAELWREQQARKAADEQA
jgi:tRNA threonylcarbamoyladenosine biosynthesis protein TsaB